MANFYTAKKTIKGTEYVAQFNGISASLEAIDKSYIDGTNNMSMVKLSKYLLENVIVEPRGLTADSFESMEEFNEVITFAREVMQGDFRNQEDEGAAAKKSKK
jgi:hypothetical protein